jgi:hypothetical protein
MREGALPFDSLVSHHAHALNPEVFPENLFSLINDLLALAKSNLEMSR